LYRKEVEELAKKKRGKAKRREARQRAREKLQTQMMMNPAMMMMMQNGQTPYGQGALAGGEQASYYHDSSLPGPPPGGPSQGPY